jgi:hypothetical protein
MKCNKCKSSNVQKYQVIHEQGTSNINLGSNTVGGGVGFGGGLRGGVGLARTGSAGTSQTLLAKKTQPPKDKRLTFSIAILIFLFFLYFLDKSKYVFAVTSIFGTALCIYTFKMGSEKYNKDMSDWLKTWYCNKCGNSFVEK